MSLGTKLSLHSLALLAAASTLAGCAQESPKPDPAPAAAAPVAPVASDSPDKLYPELARNYADAAAALKGFCEGGLTDAQAWAKVKSLESKRIALVGRSSAMLAAHPEWKEVSRQWFDRTARSDYLNYALNANCPREVISANKTESMTARQDKLDRFNEMQQEASKLLATTDPDAKARLDAVLSRDLTASRRERDRAEDAWKRFKESLGLADAEYSRF